MQNKYLNKLHKLHKVKKPNIYKPKLNWNTESQISLSRYVKYYNNMEPKKKINWARIWQIIRDIILAALTADSVRNL